MLVICRADQLRGECDEKKEEEEEEDEEVVEQDYFGRPLTEAGLRGRSVWRDKTGWFRTGISDRQIRGASSSDPFRKGLLARATLAKPGS